MKRKIEVSLPTGQIPVLTAAEREILATLGIEDDPAGRIPLNEALAIQETLVATSLPLAEASKIIGVEPSELRERLEDGYLLGIWLVGDHWRVLAFKMTDDGLLPGLDMVPAKIPRDSNPVSIWAFFTTPQPRLMKRGRMVEPGRGYG